MFIVKLSIGLWKLIFSNMQVVYLIHEHFHTKSCFNDQRKMTSQNLLTKCSLFMNHRRLSHNKR